jgi:uncharacterized protein
VKLSSLPLFPLQAVLFPGGHLPLRVFEVRYLHMVRKCFEVGAPFGVVSITKGSEVARAGGQENFEAVGTLARVDKLQQVQAGLLTVECTGTQRFRIERSEKMAQAGGLWIADVERMDDDLDIAVPPDLKPVSDALRRVEAELAERGPAPFYGSAANYDQSGWVANRWCELLPAPMELKQRLMQLDSPLMRLELVSDLLERMGVVPREADPNGQGQ